MAQRGSRISQGQASYGEPGQLHCYTGFTDKSQLLLFTLYGGNLAKLGVGPMPLNQMAFEEVVQETIYLYQVCSRG